MDFRFHQRNVSSLEKNYNIWEILYSLRIGEYALNFCEVGYSKTKTPNDS